MKLGEPGPYVHNELGHKCFEQGNGLATLNMGTSLARAEFKDMFTPVANLTTVDVKVGIGAQVDLALMLSYVSRNYSFDIGYNLWARTCERIKLDCDCPTKLADGHTWVLKGNSFVYAQSGDSQTITKLCFNECDGTAIDNVGIDTPSAMAYKLGPSQSKATIHDGSTNNNFDIIPLTPTDVIFATNRNVDSPRLVIHRTVYHSTPLQSGPPVAPRADAISFDPLLTFCTGQHQQFFALNSYNPVYLTECDIDFESAATKGLSHKVFAHFSYQWLDKENYVPFLGVGGSGEFANNSGNCCPNTCPTTASSGTSKSCVTSSCCKDDCDTACKRCALSQWSVWVKGGISFD